MGCYRSCGDIGQHERGVKRRRRGRFEVGGHHLRLVSGTEHREYGLGDQAAHGEGHIGAALLQKLGHSRRPREYAKSWPCQVAYKQALAVHDLEGGGAGANRVNASTVRQAPQRLL